jgi:hypothetical protein
MSNFFQVLAGIINNFPAIRSLSSLCSFLRPLEAAVKLFIMPYAVLSSSQSSLALSIIPFVNSNSFPITS